jgi:ferredoxin
MADDEHRESRLGRLGRALRRGASRVRGKVGSHPPEGPVRVSFEGQGEVEVPWGTTILAAAAQAGVDVPHYCGGTCSCGTCRVEIRGGAKRLSPRDGREAMVLGSDRTGAGDRLACQARLLGHATIHVPDWF